MGNLAAKALEGQLADEKISGLLVAADLAEGDGSGTVAVGLLDASGGMGGLASGFGGQMLAGCLPSGAFAGGLLCTNHVFEIMILMGMMVMQW